MRLRKQLAALCATAAFSACSVDGVTFVTGDDPAVCGDGKTDAIERCDDGNVLDDDGCDSNCTVTSCGNGIITMGEACDDGNTTSGDGCEADCRLRDISETCGNGDPDPGEACDDGNTIPGDGCEPDCSIRVTITLQPDGAAGKDGRAFSLQPDTASPGTTLLYAQAWTFSGDAGTDRSFLDFAIPPPPAGAELLNATLYLFAVPSVGHSTLSGSNELVIRQIVEPWEESLVSWTAQPASDSSSQIVLPPSVSPTQDYSIDVTFFVERELGAADQFHGFMFQLLTEQHYRAVIFGSSDHTDPALRPKLVLEYGSAPP